MATAVSDTVANWPEAIEHVVKVIGRSSGRKTIFEAIYRGKKNPKSVSDLIKTTRMSHVVVLHRAKELVNEQIIHQVKTSQGTAYEKIGFYQKNKEENPFSGKATGEAQEADHKEAATDYWSKNDD